MTTGDRIAGMGPSAPAVPCYKSASVSLSHRKRNRDEGKEEAM